MLVLTRAIGERLIIGNGEISLHVLEIRGNQVRLGIEAPRHISVHREEIYQRIKEGQQQGLKNPEEQEGQINNQISAELSNAL